MTSPPSPTTTSRSPSCGWPASWSATRTWSLSRCPPSCPQRSRWTRTGSSRSRRICRRHRPRHCPTRTRTCKREDRPFRPPHSPLPFSPPQSQYKPTNHQNSFFNV
uniref:(northern house mosquito) hypothetical protein n=1 Tax=Culex pipiens TaxID=7175 RepID=A0A8D8ETU9_CULPI